MVVHVGPGIAVRLDPGRERGDRQLVGMDLVDLLPVQRRRHLRAEAGAYRPRAEHRLVRRVLVEVEEDPFASLFLPPCRRHQIGVAPLELAGGGDGRPPDVVGIPPRLEPDVDVHAAVAGRLRVADDPELVEEGPHLGRRCPDVREVVAGLRVEVETELVGVFRVVGEVRPDVEAEAPDVDRPHDVGEVDRDQGARRRAIRGAHRRRLQPVGRGLRDTFLKEVRPARAFGEALHQRRPAAHRAHQRLGEAEVVVDEVELGLAVLGEEHLVGVRDVELVPVDLEDLLVGRGHVVHASQDRATCPVSSVTGVTAGTGGGPMSSALERGRNPTSRIATRPGGWHWIPVPPSRSRPPAW